VTIGRETGRRIGMVSKTAARRKVALVKINASASRISAAKEMRTKGLRRTKRLMRRLAAPC
jgi:hypothetical protein